MSKYYERSVVEEYPGADVIIPGDLDAGDCPNWPSIQALVKEIGCGVEPLHPTTIIGGLAYTEATVAELDSVCTL